MPKHLVLASRDNFTAMGVDNVSAHAVAADGAVPELTSLAAWTGLGATSLVLIRRRRHQAPQFE